MKLFLEESQAGAQVEEACSFPIQFIDRWYKYTTYRLALTVLCHATDMPSVQKIQAFSR